MTHVENCDVERCFLGSDRAVAAIFGRGAGRPFRDHRQVVEGIIYRLRTGIAWRDLPASFGPWQTVWKRHRRFSIDGTWDRIHAGLLAEADAAGEVDWTLAVDSTINRAHQHATNLPRAEGPTGG